MLQDNFVSVSPADPSCLAATDDELTRAAFHASPIRAGVVEVVEDDLRIVQANRALGAHFGVEPEQLRGRLASELPIGRDLFATWTAMAREAWALGES